MLSAHSLIDSITALEGLKASLEADSELGHMPLDPRLAGVELAITWLQSQFEKQVLIEAHDFNESDLPY